MTVIVEKRLEQVEIYLVSKGILAREIAFQLKKKKKRRKKKNFYTK